jgi:hypothetical protein
MPFQILRCLYSKRSSDEPLRSALGADRRGDIRFSLRSRMSPRSCGLRRRLGWPGGMSDEPFDDDRRGQPAQKIRHAQCADSAAVKGFSLAEGPHQRSLDRKHACSLDCFVASAPRNDGVRFAPTSPRHCEPTGRANARPTTGSAKQSSATQQHSLFHPSG